MGAGDRDYMRDRRLDWASGSRGLTLKLVIGLVVVFIAQNAFHGLTERLWLSWPILRSGQVWTLVTSNLAHGGVGHLIGNLFGVWIFGGIAEETLRSRGFVRLTLAGAIGPALVYAATQAVSGDGVPTLGYSGVVMAYLVVAAFRRPNERIYLYGLFGVPIWLLGLIYVLLDLNGLSSQMRGGGVGVNHLVHLVGALVGLWAHFTEARFGLPDRLLTPRRVEPSGRRPAISPPGRLDPHGPAAREEVNRLLDKIAADGIGSLTEDERDFLNRASKGYR